MPKQVRGVYLDQATLDLAKEAAWQRRISLSELFRAGKASFLAEPDITGWGEVPPSGKGRFSVVIDGDEWNALKDAAWERHLNLSEAVRLILKHESETETSE